MVDRLRAERDAAQAAVTQLQEERHHAQAAAIGPAKVDKPHYQMTEENAESLEDVVASRNLLTRQLASTQQVGTQLVVFAYSCIYLLSSFRLCPSTWYLLSTCERLLMGWKPRILKFYSTLKELCS